MTDKKIVDELRGMLGQLAWLLTMFGKGELSHKNLVVSLRYSSEWADTLADEVEAMQ